MFCLSQTMNMLFGNDFAALISVALSEFVTSPKSIISVETKTRYGSTENNIGTKT